MTFTYIYEQQGSRGLYFWSQYLRQPHSPANAEETWLFFLFSLTHTILFKGKAQ